MARLTEDRDSGGEVGPERPTDANSVAEGASELEYEPSSDRSLRLLFLGLASVSVLVGVLGYWRYANSEQWVVEGTVEMDAVGAQFDTEQCIDASVGWYNGCEGHNANAAVCLQGVGIVMQHCLSARERDETCELYLDPASSVHQISESFRERARNPEKAGESGRWVYARCEEREMVCRSKRECACAEAYRAIDSFCRTGQQAVQL